MKKFYVVWNGRQTGVFDSWTDCKAQVEGFERPQYKSFKTREAAEQAFAAGVPADYYHAKKQKKATALVDPPTDRHDTVLPLPPEVEAAAWAVDAACSGNPGMMEYQGIDLRTGQRVFHFGPLFGTNNIGEFLAIVHALALLTKNGEHLTVYSDSRNALKWVREKRCKTKLPLTAKSREVLDMARRAEQWLATHAYDVRLQKWDTEQWGEIPADFGRK